MHNFVIISGCSGGGKSSLLEELRHRGYPCVDEPGRRIVRQELERGGDAVPWINPAAFLQKAVQMSRSDRASAPRSPGWVFFDRGLVDAASALLELTGRRDSWDLLKTHRYHRRVFLTPPWPEIYRADTERRHGFDAACAEYDRLLRHYPALGYQTVILPKANVPQRADFLLKRLVSA